MRSFAKLAEFARSSSASDSCLPLATRPCLTNRRPRVSTALEAKVDLRASRSLACGFYLKTNAGGLAVTPARRPAPPTLNHARVRPVLDSPTNKQQAVEHQQNNRTSDGSQKTCGFMWSIPAELLTNEFGHEGPGNTEQRSDDEATGIS